MCWNADVSLNTFLFAVFGAVFGYINGFNRKILLLYCLFSCMQFYEYMIWKNINNREINRIWSIIGYIIIQLEPIVALNILDASIIKYVLLLLYTTAVLISATIYKHDFTTIVAKNGHLKWNWLESPKTLFDKFMWFIWFSALLIPLCIVAIKYKYYVPFLFILLTLVLTIYYYFTAGTFGTMWCWISNALWLYVIYCGIRKLHC